jgi:HEAT repeat protein
MPHFISVPFLLAVIIIGSGTATALLLATAAIRVIRLAAGRHRARTEREVRPLVLEVVGGEQPPPGLISARGARGRAAERVIFSYLERVRGESAALLTEALAQRGALGRILGRSYSKSRHRRAGAAERLGLTVSLEAEHRLWEIVNSDHSLEVRIVATRALGNAGSAGAAATLLRSLSRADPVPEGIVASALLELGPEAVPALRATLSGDAAGGRRQRAMAANLLGLLDAMPAWEALADNVTSGDLEVRANAVRALGRLGMPQAVSRIVGCLAPEEEPELRAVAARALGRLGDPRSAPALAACLDDPHYWVAHNAAEALAALGAAGHSELTRAAASGRPGAMHAREALARDALASGRLPQASVPAPAAAPPGLGPAGNGSAPGAADAPRGASR